MVIQPKVDKRTKKHKMEKYKTIILKHEENQATIYPANDRDFLNDTFSVRVSVLKGEFIDVPVYMGISAHSWGATVKNPNGTNATQTNLTSFVNFDFIGKVNISITYNKNIVNKVAIRPTFLNIDYKQDGNMIIISLDSPKQFFVDINDDILNNLQVFANAFEKSSLYESCIEQNDSDVIYFEPGYHTVENNKHITLDSKGIPTVKLSGKQTVYIAGGATVCSTFEIIRENDVTIRGHGIISMLDYTSHEYGLYNEYTKDMITIVGSDNINIDGIVILNPTKMGIFATYSTNMRINNVKFITHVLSGDGIHAHNCHDAKVSNCFFRVSDDCIALFAMKINPLTGLNDIDVYNWDIYNIVTYTIARALCFGGHGSRDAGNRRSFYNINAQDIYVVESKLNANRGGAVRLIVCDENTMRDILVENLYLEGTLKMKAFKITNEKLEIYSPYNGYTIEGIVFS